MMGDLITLHCEVSTFTHANKHAHTHVSYTHTHPGRLQKIDKMGQVFWLPSYKHVVSEQSTHTMYLDCF